MSAIRHRCAWVNLRNPLYVRYHDREWGRRPKIDQALYELFILETFQAGLSWECVLNRREAIKAAFDGFDMRRRGMKFIGSTTVYAFLQAAGFIGAHGPECDLGKQR